MQFHIFLELMCHFDSLTVGYLRKSISFQSISNDHHSPSAVVFLVKGIFSQIIQFYHCVQCLISGKVFSYIVKGTSISSLYTNGVCSWLAIIANWNSKIVKLHFSSVTILVSLTDIIKQCFGQKHFLAHHIFNVAMCIIFGR